MPNQEATESHQEDPTSEHHPLFHQQPVDRLLRLRNAGVTVSQEGLPQNYGGFPPSTPPPTKGTRHRTDEKSSRIAETFSRAMKEDGTPRKHRASYWATFTLNEQQTPGRARFEIRIDERRR